MHTDHKKSNSILLFVGIIAIAIASRLLPHWHNFTAVGAVGLFGVAYFKRTWWAYLAPCLALFISDLILNNLVYSHFFEGTTILPRHALWTYGGFAGMIFVAHLLMKKVHLKFFLSATIAGTVLFFLISNFGTFLQTPLYPKSASGLASAYIAGLPFALNSLLANLFYGAILIGGYQLIFYAGLKTEKAPANTIEN